MPQCGTILCPIPPAPAPAHLDPWHRFRCGCVPGGLCTATPQTGHSSPRLRRHAEPWPPPQTQSSTPWSSITTHNQDRRSRTRGGWILDCGWPSGSSSSTIPLLYRESLRYNAARLPRFVNHHHPRLVSTAPAVNCCRFQFQGTALHCTMASEGVRAEDIVAAINVIRRDPRCILPALQDRLARIDDVKICRMPGEPSVKVRYRWLNPRLECGSALHFARTPST